MKKTFAMLEDIAIVVDVLFTFVMVYAQNNQNNSLYMVALVISGASLVLALIFMIIKRILISKNK